tara:strand:- start:2090 stop:2383 length:294 start_codon:yes stop_codon:yes gene_type:complete
MTKETEVRNNEVIKETNFLKEHLDSKAYTALAFIDAIVKNYLKGISHVQQSEEVEKAEKEKALKHEKEVKDSWTYVIEVIQGLTAECINKEKSNDRS